MPLGGSGTVLWQNHALYGPSRRVGPRVEVVERLSIKGQWRLEATGHDAEDSKQAETSHPQNDLAIAGPRSREGRGPQQPFLSRRSTRLPACNRRIRKLVLLGASAVVQQDCGGPLSDAFRVTQTCPRHDQSSARSGQTACIRSRRLGAAKRRLGGRHTASQGR